MVKVAAMTDDDFATNNSKYFERGPHEVIIEDYRVGKSEAKGTPYITFYVKSAAGEAEDETDRQYVTPNTYLYILKTLSAISVHNRDTEEAKEKVREYFKSIDDTDVITSDKFLEKLKGMQAWILRDEDKDSPKPNGGYYLRNRLYSYKPTLKASEDIDEASVQAEIDSGEPLNLAEIPF